MELEVLGGWDHQGLGLYRPSKLYWGMANGYQRAQDINPSVGLRIKF